MKWLLIFTAACCCFYAGAQTKEIDSLKHVIAIERESMETVRALESLSYAYLDSYPDSALQYAVSGLQLAKKLDLPKGEAICTNAIGNVYFHMGDNAKALQIYLKYLHLKEQLNEGDDLAVAYFNIASVYTEDGDYRQALHYVFEARKQDDKAKDSASILYDMYTIASIYTRMNQQDSSLLYCNNAYELSKQLNEEILRPAILNIYGDAYMLKQNTGIAAAYYHLSIPYAEAVKDYEVITADYYGLAKVFDKLNVTDSTLYYARKGLAIAQQAPFLKQVLDISTFLMNQFSHIKKFDSAFYYQSLSVQTKDSLFNIEQVKKVQNLKLAEQQRQQSVETARLQYKNRIRLFIIMFATLIILTVAVVLWFYNKKRKNANAVLRQQKQKLKKTLKKLRSTQAQLIQKEKMASLGEVTAGIAHEIQNPLNFVNNFSEVNNELIEEMNEVNSINEIKIIAADIQHNNEKIAHHGRRAEAIVKAMLQHSRQTKGIKEPAAINIVCEECIKLSYKNFKAKEKHFSAEVITAFDAGLPNINISVQDVGRALSNILNNAFYSANEKKKTAGENYQPLITLSTKAAASGGGCEIIITDNGAGIDKKNMDKIFQPFFTTKPTGQGTGLGLSLAYDIITKQHNGSVTVHSKTGEGAEFIIQLPLA